MEKLENQSYVRNSSFLSKDIEARAKDEAKVNTQTLTRVKQPSPPKQETVTSPPVSTFKLNKTNSKEDQTFNPPKADKVENYFSPPKAIMTQNSISREKIEAPLTELQMKLEKVAEKIDDNLYTNQKKVENITSNPKLDEAKVFVANPEKNDDSNGVGDKIKKFERVAEDAGATIGRLSRANSIRGRSLTDRLDSDDKDELPSPLPNPPTERMRQLNVNNTSSNLPGARWTKTEFDTPRIKKPEPQKVPLIKPEFKPLQSPVDATIRSPSLGAKLPDQFSSHGTAFRNVASNEAHKFNDDVNTQNNVKACKIKKEKFSVSKGSSYFTRGSEDMWLVKKKDIEEIEERVLDSFMRAGGNVCVRNESVRPSSDSGHLGSMSHTMGRNKRPAYARSESLDPQLAGARAQTLKRQSSVACTCGHDKNKPRAKSSCDATVNRARSRSHGDDDSQTQILDKYETLV